jgi:hypothetical protein
MWTDISGMRRRMNEQKMVRKWEGLERIEGRDSR